MSSLLVYVDKVRAEKPAELSRLRFEKGNFMVGSEYLEEDEFVCPLDGVVKVTVSVSTCGMGSGEVRIENETNRFNQTYTAVGGYVIAVVPLFRGDRLRFYASTNNSIPYPKTQGDSNVANDGGRLIIEQV